MGRHKILVSIPILASCLMRPAVGGDGCAAPTEVCVPRVSSAPARIPDPEPARAPAAPAAPQMMTVQRSVMQAETVMVPMTVMTPQVVWRQRLINEQVPVTVSAAPVAQSPSFAAPAAAPTCAGSANTQMALMALAMMSRANQANAPRQQVAAAPSERAVELQNRVDKLEKRLDLLLQALEKR